MSVRAEEKTASESAGPAFDVPVALFVFNRPHFADSAVARLRPVRPSRLLVVADGPRPTCPGDVEACAATRAVATEVDWPCTIETEFSDVNLGCDRRLLSGLDWVFSRVDRAVILEDDVVADPSFFAWCAGLLDRYDGDDSVGMVVGHNELGRWGDAESSHLLVRHASVWGWATWAQSWRVLSDTIRMFDESASAALDVAGFDPLFADHVRVLAGKLASPEGLSWDFSLIVALAACGVLAAASPVNLTGNIGWGAGATRTVNDDDISALLHTWPAPTRTGDPRPEPDARYDRFAATTFLLSSYRQPERIVRLAKFSRLLGPEIEDSTMPLEHVLAPVADREETAGLLRHLRDVSDPSPTIERLLAAFDPRDEGPSDAAG